jgi:hypothetical protein
MVMQYSPRAFRDATVVEARRKMLREPHIASLTAFVDDLRAANPGVHIPYMDPLSGGIHAEILFLFQHPGLKTKASGFLSIDNDDKTAANTTAILQKIGIKREVTLFWNTFFGYLGPETLRGLIPLLTKVHTVVLVGNEARDQAGPLIEALFPSLDIASRLAWNICSKLD